MQEINYKYAVVRKYSAPFFVIMALDEKIPSGMINKFVKKHGRRTLIFHNEITGFSIESEFDVRGIFSTFEDISEYNWIEKKLEIRVASGLQVERNLGYK